MLCSISGGRFIGNRSPCGIHFFIYILCYFGVTIVIDMS